MMRIAKLRMQLVGCLLAGLIGICYSLAVGQSSEVKAGYAKAEHMIPIAPGVGGVALAVLIFRSFLRIRLTFAERTSRDC